MLVRRKVLAVVCVFAFVRLFCLLLKPKGGLLFEADERGRVHGAYSRPRLSVDSPRLQKRRTSPSQKNRMGETKIGNENPLMRGDSKFTEKYKLPQQCQLLEKSTETHLPSEIHFLKTERNEHIMNGKYFVWRFLVLLLLLFVLSSQRGCYRFHFCLRLNSEVCLVRHKRAS